MLTRREFFQKSGAVAGGLAAAVVLPTFPEAREVDLPSKYAAGSNWEWEIDGWRPGGIVYIHGEEWRVVHITTATPD